jgi:hypothetical protein
VGNGGAASVGADGSVYQLFAAGTVPTSGALGDTLTPSGSNAPIALSYTDTPTFAQVSVAPSLTPELLSASTQKTTYGALLSDLANTFGLANYTALGASVFNASPFSGDLLINAATGFTVNQAISGAGAATIDAEGGALTVSSDITSTARSISLTSNAGGAITLGANVSAANAELTLTSAGAINQTAGVLTAAELTGSSAGTTTLNGANALSTLNIFSTGTGFTLTDASALTVNGAVGGGTGGVSVADAGTLTTGASGVITASGAIALNAATDIDLGANVTSTGGAGVTLIAGDTGSGAGTVNFSNGAVASTSGRVVIYYNPAGGYGGANASTQTYSNGAYSYANPYTADVGGGAKLTAYMLVNTLTDLQSVGASATSLTGVYAQSGDIDASATATIGNMANNLGAGFTPIGTGEVALSAVGSFTGLYNGLGYTISGLTETPVAGTRWLGLFGAVGAGGQVVYANLVNASIIGYGYTGGLVGDLAGSLTNVSVSGAVTGPSGTGGLVGVAEAGSTITGAAANVTVTGSGNDVGGLAGASFGAIANSSASGAVSGVDHVGGLIGLNDGSTANLGSLSGSTASGTVIGNDYVGGLVGLNFGAVSASSAGGAVSGAQYVGGLVGWNAAGATIQTSYATGATTGGASTDGSGNDYVGGLVGVNYGAISDTYATGAVSGVQVVGGLVGSNSVGGSVSTSYTTSPVTGSGAGIGTAFGTQSGEVTYVYGFPALSGQPMMSGDLEPTSTGDATALSTSQEGDPAAYAGFDFTTTWTQGSPPALTNTPTP